MNRQMGLLTPLVLVSAVVAGSLHSSRTSIFIGELVLTRLVAPVALGIALAVSSPTRNWRHHILLLFLFAAISEITRGALFLLRAGDWRYIYADPGMKIVLFTSFAFQMVAGVIAWRVTRIARSEA